MNRKIFIERDGEVVFKGKLLSLPFKEKAIIDKSIELFDDDEPCVIHQSFVIKTYAEQLANWLNDGELRFKDYPQTLEWLAIDGLEDCLLKVR